MEKITIDKTVMEKLLEERRAKYGSFTMHATITQNLKRVMRDTPNWSGLSDDKKEALEMVVHKIGRILNDDPGYKDSWDDIIGYTTRITETLED